MVDSSQAIGGLLGKGCLWVRLQGFKLEYRRDCCCKADKADGPSEERTTSHHGRWMLAIPSMPVETVSLTLASIARD